MCDRSLLDGRKGRRFGPRIAVLCLAASILYGAAPLHAEEPPSERWMAHCAQNLAPEHLPATVVHSYCACMAGVGEEAEMLTWSQTELERSYPPAHVKCHDAARE